MHPETVRQSARCYERAPDHELITQRSGERSENDPLVNWQNSLRTFTATTGFAYRAPLKVPALNPQSSAPRRCGTKPRRDRHQRPTGITTKLQVAS